MAVEERQAGLIGYEVNHSAAVIRNDYRIFYDAPGFGAIHLYKFELVSVQMERMRIICAVAKYQAVTSALL